MKKYLLPLILLISLFLRIFQLSQFPAGLNADEAAIGYNTYSLLTTGKDEFGHSWPISFQSFNDFKPGLYFYLTLPFVGIFGLSEFSVRLPSALLGVGIVLLAYLIAKQIFKEEKAALVSAFLFSISPWALHFSRGGWESNAALFFMVLGVYLFFLCLKKKVFLIFSVLAFIASVYTYHSARIIAPLLLLGLVSLYKKQILIKSNLKTILVSVVAGIFLVFPVLISMFGEGGTSRFSGVGIFADQGPLWRANEMRGQHANPFSLIPRVFHNKVIEYGFKFLGNYLSHFNGNFLFISGDEIQRNKIPEMGQMYLVEIPFLLLGFFFLFKKKPGGWLFMLWWLAVSPVASALTFQSPHAIRALNMAFPLIVIAGYGLYCFFEELRGRLKKVQKPLLLLVALVYFWNISFYLHQYYIHYPQTYPASWQYGFKELVDYVYQNQDNYEKVYVTSKYDQPYILFAFYLKYPPSVFQTEARLSERDVYGFSTVENFSKYYFGPISLGSSVYTSRSLVVGTPEEIPDSATIVKRIYFKDGKTEAFRIIEN